MADFEEEDVKRVLKKYESYLGNLPGVTGVGYGLVSYPALDHIGIIVMLKSQAYVHSVPKSLDGIPVSAQVTGPFYAH